MVQAHKVTREDMELDAGLPDDFIGTITKDTSFEINQEYAEAAGVEIPLLTLYLDSPAFDIPVSQGYSTGEKRNWKIKAKGKEITSEAIPDAHRFVQTCRAGQLVSRMFELVGGGDRVKGQEILMARHGEDGYWMTQAPFFYGLTFHWKRESLSQVDATKKSDVLLPVRYIENSNGAGATPAGTASTATATGAIATEEEIAKIVEKSVDKDGSPLTLLALRKAILATPELKGNKPLMNEIFNKGYLDTLIADGTIFVLDE